MRSTRDKNRPRNPPYLQYLIENKKLKDDWGTIGIIFVVIWKMGTMVVMFPWCLSYHHRLNNSFVCRIYMQPRIWRGAIFLRPIYPNTRWALIWVCHPCQENWLLQNFYWAWRQYLLMIHANKMFRNLLNPCRYERYHIAGFHVATSARLLRGGMAKVPIKAGSFRRPNLTFCSEWELPWIIGMLPVTCELLGGRFVDQRL